MSQSTSLISNLLRVVHDASPLQIVGAIITLLIARFILRGIYRVYFHPLHSYPGPKLSAFTRIPKHIASWKGCLNEYTTRLHSQYGEVVRLSPDEISFIHPDAWRDIYGHGAGHGKGSRGSVPPKHFEWYAQPVNKVPSMLITESPAEHARVRRIFKPAFSDRALKEQEPLFLKYVTQLVGNLRRAVSEDPDRKFDMVRNYNFTTFDVMGDLTFGESLHMLDQAEYDPWVSIIFGQVKSSNRLSLLSYYPRLSRFVRANLPAKLQQLRVQHFQYSVDRVTKRLEQGRASEGKDLWDLALTDEKDKQLTRREMDSNAAIFMVAGTETTATLLSGLTYLLLKNPDKMTALIKEIRSSFSDERNMTMETISALPYLGACLKEALRLYPPVPMGLPHMTPANGSTICGHFVPPHTNVSAPHHAMYTSPLNFKEPDSFIPERWLGDEKFASDRRAALQPFSAGSRDCLGKNMAYHEMRLIITQVLFNFNMELCPESENWTDQKAYTLWEKHPLMVKLKDVRA